MRNNIINNIVDNLIVVIQKSAELEKKPKEFIPGELLHRSEIHIIDVIGRYKESHVSEIARRFGVTKGAASQLIKKLGKKGYVEKKIDPSNQTRTLIMLTDKGKTAFDCHHKYHKEMDQGFFNFLEDKSEDSLTQINGFLEEVKKMFR